MRFVTWNIEHFGKGETQEDDARRRRASDVLHSIPDLLADPESPSVTPIDVVAVQEIRQPQAFLTLAERLGMHCHIPMDRGQALAWDPGRLGFGMGLMWRPGIVPVPDSLRQYSKRGGYMHHGMALVDLVVDEVTLTAGCTHFSPHMRNLREDEGALVARAFRLDKPIELGIVGMDRNCIGASRTDDGAFYDDDPWADVPWQPAMATVCQWDETGRHWADRRAADALNRGGLVDLTAASRVPWTPTHLWSKTDIATRIDAAHGTVQIADAVETVNVIRSEMVESVSDHWPVVTDVDLTRLARTR